VPPKKGRKRRPRERRHEGDEPRPAAASLPVRDEESARSTPSDLPKLRVRVAGFVLAVVTMFFGLLNVKAGLDDGSVPVLVTGVLLIVLSLVLGVLALVPARVRILLTRK
jgi:hypothetical protein